MIAPCKGLQGDAQVNIYSVSLKRKINPPNK